MPSTPRRVAVTTPYFEFFPELKAELATRYPGARFRTDRHRLSEEQFIEFAADCDTAVIGIENLSGRVFTALPHLKVLSLCSAGVDHIDPVLLNKHGIAMWWSAGVNKMSVAELALSFMILSLRRAHEFASTLRHGEWKGPIGFGADLRGKIVGIHGCGNIGKEVVKLLQPFGVEIIACDRADISEFCRQWNVTSVGPQELWTRSDVLTIHLPRNATTIGLYTARVLAKLKPGVVLINCARGGLVDETALASHLKSGAIAAAAFDVFAREPANGNPLLELPTFFATPHIGATTRDSWRAMLRSGMDGIEKAWRPEPGVYPFD
jgi:D-3-phosphoglycerate dehydrogenase / 2-oxoglutarate reductase